MPQQERDASIASCSALFLACAAACHVWMLQSLNAQSRVGRLGKPQAFSLVSSHRVFYLSHTCISSRPHSICPWIAF